MASGVWTSGGGTTSARSAAMHWLNPVITNPYRTEFATVLVVLFWTFTVWLVIRPPARRLLRAYIGVGSGAAFVIALALAENIVAMEQHHTAWWLVLQACTIVTGSLLLELALACRAERRVIHLARARASRTVRWHGRHVASLRHEAATAPPAS